MATVVCLLAKQRGGPRIAAQVLIYPATGAGFDSASYREFGQGYFLTAETSRWFWHQYAPDRSADQEPTACPLLASLAQLKGLPPALIMTAECDILRDEGEDYALKGLPPTLIMTAECDILRDEGEDYARKLMQAGVPVTCTRYLGAIHAFMGANALIDTPPTRAATAQMSAMLREALAEKAASVSVK